MPIRVFKSTAFAPLSPGRVRLAGYEYRAFPIDPPAPPAPEPPPPANDMVITSTYYGPGDDFDVLDGVGVGFGDTFAACAVGGILTFNLSITNNSDFDFIFSPTTITGDPAWFINTDPWDDLGDSTLPAGQSCSGCFVVALDTSGITPGATSCEVTLNYTKDGVPLTFVIPVSLIVIDCDGLIAIDGPGSSGNVSYQASHPYEDLASAEAALDSYASPERLGVINPFSGNIARVDSFNVVQTTPESVTVSGRVTWQLGDDGDGPGTVVYIQLRNVTTALSIDYNVTSDVGSGGITSSNYTAFGCCGLSAGGEFDPNQQIDDGVGPRIGTWTMTAITTDTYGIQFGVAGEDGAAGVDFEFVISNGGGPLPASTVMAFLKNETGGRQVTPPPGP